VAQSSRWGGYDTSSTGLTGGADKTNVGIVGVWVAKYWRKNDQKAYCCFHSGCRNFGKQTLTFFFLKERFFFLPQF